MNETKRDEFIVEQHPDGDLAYLLGLRGVMVGQGESHAATHNDVRSAIRFHLETFGPVSCESQ